MVLITLELTNKVDQSCWFDKWVDCRDMWFTEVKLDLSKRMTIILLFFCLTGTKLLSNRIQEVSVVTKKGVTSSKRNGAANPHMTRDVFCFA